VPAILLSWFPGQEFGHALADVLLGSAEPGGRLPTTWPAREEDTPVLSTEPVDGALDYSEGLHVGYRGWLRSGAAPAYPFGHGLGYTTWSYEGLSAPESVGTGDALEVRVLLRNTGDVAGREVVQAYLSRERSAVERPAAWLAGFAAVEADPGAMAEAVVRVLPRAFQHWQPDGWRTEPGRFSLLVGSSVTDVKARAVVEVLGRAPI
jgi:beta-glucosidase